MTQRWLTAQESAAWIRVVAVLELLPAALAAKQNAAPTSEQPN